MRSKCSVSGGWAAEGAPLLMPLDQAQPLKCQKHGKWTGATGLEEE